MNTIRAGLLAALGALAACAAPPPPKPPSPPPKPPETVDGEYRGTSTRFQADSRACPHPGLVRLDVIGQRVPVPLGPRHLGRCHDRTGRRDHRRRRERSHWWASGRAPKIDGDVTNGNCGLHFTVTKAP